MRFQKHKDKAIGAMATLFSVMGVLILVMTPPPDPQSIGIFLGFGHTLIGGAIALVGAAYAVNHFFSEEG